MPPWSKPRLPCRESPNTCQSPLRKISFAITAWPSEIPPSFGGTRRAEKLRNPSRRNPSTARRSRYMFWNVPPLRQTRFNWSRSRMRPANFHDHGGDGVVETRSDISGRLRLRKSCTMFSIMGRMSTCAGSPSSTWKGYRCSRSACAIISSSIAAWPSKLTSCRKLIREATASNRRPQEEVSTQLMPRASMASTSVDLLFRNPVQERQSPAVRLAPNVSRR